jgi:O-antigen/teichoic acid export membrane protein
VAADAPTLRRVAVATFGARLLTVVLAAVTGVVLARALAPEGRGAYAVVVTTAATAVALGHLSVETAQVSLWKERSLRHAMAANDLVLSLVLGSAVAAATYGVVRLLGPERVPVVSQAALLTALAVVPAALLVLWTNNILVLRSRVSRVNAGLVLGATAQTAVLGVLAVLDRLTVLAVVVVWALSTALPLVVTVPSVRPDLRAVSAPVMRRQLERGLRYHPGIAVLFLLAKVDVLVVNALRPTAEVGLYALAITLAELVYLLGDAVAQSIVSRQASGDSADAADITALAVRLNGWGASILALALAATAPVLVPLVYGQDFAGAVPALLALLPGVVALGIARPIGVLLSALDRPGLLAALCGGAFALHVLLLALLVVPLGIVGAALASSAGYGALAAGYVLAGARTTARSWRAYVPRTADLAGVVRR